MRSRVRSQSEVDGNRTRRTGIARPDRFEGGGAHQVPRHLPGAPRTVALVRGTVASGDAPRSGGSEHDYSIAWRSPTPSRIPTLPEEPCRSSSAPPRAAPALVIDAGHHAERFRDQTEAGTTDSVRCTEVVVTRACYLSLRPARRSRTPVDAVVLVAEPGRTLSGRDVQRALGAPLVATIPWDPAVARAIDAGVSAASIPRPLRRLGRTLLDACASIGACAQGAA
jgi:hypothetical protein